MKKAEHRATSGMAAGWTATPHELSSHGCVHVDWASDAAIKQLNYHSVIGHTKVDVSYS